MAQLRPRRIDVGAWVTYDIANTVFWTGVVGVSIPLWITSDEMGGNDATLGYTLAATMVVVLAISPVLGAISDQMARRKPLLIGTTFICVLSTLLLGSGGLLTALSLFALALATMELGTIVYNALLFQVSTEDNRGTISGLGQGIGYIGVFIAVGVAIIFSESRGYVFVCQVVAILFLVFALPIFFLLRERGTRLSSSGYLSTVGQGFDQLVSNLRRLHEFRGLLDFLGARLFYSLGINTAVAFAVVYASQTIDMSDREIYLILLTGTAVAIPTALIWGRIVDRIGPRPVMTTAIGIWIGLMLFAVAIPWLSWTRHLWWIVGGLTGVAMAGIWTADRPYMLIFTPPQYMGEFFGLHGMVGKLGRVIGPFMWAFISATMGLGQPAALLSLVGCLVVSYVMLRRVREPVPSPAVGPMN